RQICTIADGRESRKNSYRYRTKAADTADLVVVRSFVNLSWEPYGDTFITQTISAGFMSLRIG
ncbi:hypothetical protein, partial [Mesorhizobium sp.]|uniref:hypothetical protein n=1 Tax=Mesorhizobium sp. TaxID=1871066 RepID=UPI0025BA8AEC